MAISKSMFFSYCNDQRESSAAYAKRIRSAGLFDKNNHIALSRESILEGVWGFDYFGDTRTVDTHIKSFARASRDYRELIQTVWGVGYKFDYED